MPAAASHLLRAELELKKHHYGLEPPVIMTNYRIDDYLDLITEVLELRELKERQEEHIRILRDAYEYQCQLAAIKEGE